jgi:hypothetical protein
VVLPTIPESWVVRRYQMITLPSAFQKAAFMSELFGLLLTATLETLYMVGVAALFCAAGGLALGILLPGGVLPAPLGYKTLTP